MLYAHFFLQALTFFAVYAFSFFLMAGAIFLLKSMDGRQIARHLLFAEMPGDNVLRYKSQRITSGSRSLPQPSSCAGIPGIQPEAWHSGPEQT